MCSPEKKTRGGSYAPAEVRPFGRMGSVIISLAASARRQGAIRIEKSVIAVRVQSTFGRGFRTCDEALATATVPLRKMNPPPRR
jgi:hypothetical protein